LGWITAPQARPAPLRYVGVPPTCQPGGLWRWTKESRWKLSRPPQLAGRSWAARFDAAPRPFPHFNERISHTCPSLPGYQLPRRSRASPRAAARARPRGAPATTLAGEGQPRPSARSMLTVAGLTLRTPRAYPLASRRADSRWSCPFVGPVGRGSCGRLAPLRGSGAARPSGALRAIDSTAWPRTEAQRAGAATGPPRDRPRPSFIDDLSMPTFGGASTAGTLRAYHGFWPAIPLPLGSLGGDERPWEEAELGIPGKTVVRRCR
jgi:hypothetical protein